MQVSRLFETVILLLNSRVMTAGELARHFGVSPRTVYRDVEILSQAGIPIYAAKGKNGGISLMESFVLQRSLLSKEEQGEILAALEGMKAVGTPQMGSALLKWQALFGVANSSWVHVDFSDWSPVRQNELALIKEGILGKRVIRFAYYGTSGERTQREAEPMQLWFKSRAWYLIAFCRLRQEMRLFRLTRMKDVRLMEEHFSPKDFADFPPSPSPGPPYKAAVELHLKFDAAMASRIFDEFDETQIEMLPDGSFLVCASYPEDEWVYGFLLSFGPFMTVLSPPHVRDILIDRLKKAAALYSEYDT